VHLQRAEMECDRIDLVQDDHAAVRLRTARGRASDD
jgi:hypothetical protein